MSVEEEESVHVSDIQCTLVVFPYDEKTLLFFKKIFNNHTPYRMPMNVIVP